jgi:hypothetical protein
VIVFNAVRNVKENTAARVINSMPKRRRIVASPRVETKRDATNVYARVAKRNAKPNAAWWKIAVQQSQTTDIHFAQIVTAKPKYCPCAWCNNALPL